MIQLTNETKVIKKKSKHLDIGDIVDNSLYLVRVDSNNLALKRGDVVENYFGDVRTALKRSLNYAIKGSSVALSLESMMEIIASMDEAISGLRNEAIKEQHNDH